LPPVLKEVKASREFFISGRYKNLDSGRRREKIRTILMKKGQKLTVN
jgi:hypothetical protein